MCQCQCCQSRMFSRSVVSNSLQHWGLRHPCLPWLSPPPSAYSNSYPSNRWCHQNISPSVFLVFSCLLSFPAWVFSNEMALHIKWSKYWSFSISTYNEYSGLISFRIDWFDLFAVQGTSTASWLKMMRSFSPVVLHWEYEPTEHWALKIRRAYVLESKQNEQ